MPAQAHSDEPVEVEASAFGRLRSIQLWSLALLIAAGLLNYMDRSALAIANPLIRKELGLSIADMGLLLSAFLWAYALAQLPAGLLLDRIGPRKTLAAGLAFWSLAQTAAGLVGGLGQFIAARAALGVGEAPMFPSAARAVRDWYSVDRRAFPTGCWNCVSTLGPAIAPPVLTGVELAFGWRAMFVILGIMGLLLTALWAAIYRDRIERVLTDEAAALLAEPDADGRMDIGLWTRLFRYRMTWGLLAGYFGVIYILWLFAAWLPGYLEIQRHMSIRDSGLWSAAPFAFGVLGSVSSGWAADHLTRRGVPPIGSRKTIVGASLMGMAVFTGLAAFADTAYLALGEIAAALFFNGCATTMAWAMVSVAAPRRCTGSLGSIQNFGGYLGGASAPLVTGLLVQSTGGFDVALLTGAVLALLSGAAYMFIVPAVPITGLGHQRPAAIEQERP
jgi:MFS family permease